MVLFLLLCVDSSLGSSGLVSFFNFFFTYSFLTFAAFLLPFCMYEHIMCFWTHLLTILTAARLWIICISRSSTASSSIYFAWVQYSVYTLYTHNIYKLTGLSQWQWHLLLYAFIFFILLLHHQVIRLFFSLLYNHNQQSSCSSSINRSTFIK